MSSDIYEKILTDHLHTFLSYEDDIIDELLFNPNLAIKERVKKIENLEIIIYSNDHTPPHFHIKSNDFKINAKFLLKRANTSAGKLDQKN
jgi:hypothetical protein